VVVPVSYLAPSAILGAKGAKMLQILEPKKPWAVVLCKLEGSSASADVEQAFRDWFVQSGSVYKSTIADFWRDQTFGLVDVSATEVIGGKWLPCGWSALTSTGGSASYPGITRRLDRRDYREVARSVLKAARRNPALYRGVISVFNFGVGGGAEAPDVVYGLNGVTGDLEWAEGGWQHCGNCAALVTSVGGRTASVCAAGGAHVADPAPRYLVPTDAALAQAGGPFQVCQNCGCLYTGAGAVSSICPAGGGHQATSPSIEYRLMSNWATPIGDNSWRLCAKCGAVVNASSPDVPCPSGGRHNVAASAKLGLCYIDYGLSRSWLLHEMGHCFGFEHGHSREPQSMELVGDCNPGAYADPFDIMSYENADAYTPQKTDRDDAAWGHRGPSLAVHQLEYAGLIRDQHVGTFDTHAVIQTVPLRSVRRPDLPGFAVTRVGNLSIEYRPKVGWDAGLNVPEPGAVLVYDNAIPGSALLSSTKGRKFLARSDRLETPDLGRVGGWSITASRLTDHTATIEVTRQHSFSYTWQRWLVLPCAYSASSTRPKREDLAQLVAGVEAYWNELAAGAFDVGGSWVVSAGGNISDDWVALGYTAQQDETRNPIERVRAAVQAALRLPNPTNPSAPLYLDWRAFTGILISRDEDLGAGYLGELMLPTGNTLPYRVDCRYETKTGGAAGERRFQVIELGSKSLNHAGVCRAIARSLGLEERPDDPYTLMSPGAFRFTDPLRPAWGDIGPALDTDSLNQLGWLPEEQIFAATPRQGEHSAGTVTLVPWPVTSGQFARHRERRPRPRYVRLEAGSYSFEFRRRSGWDSGLPAGSMVVARTAGESPTALLEGQSVDWGGDLRAITGGGDVSVTSLSPTEAQLAYHVDQERVIVGGGGSLGGGGTILITPDGRITRIPPGDPPERQIRPVVDAVSALLDRIQREQPRRREAVKGPRFAGVVALNSGTLLLFRGDEMLEVGPGESIRREIEPNLNQLSSLTRRLHP
jgi:hypothetical protein